MTTTRLLAFCSVAAFLTVASPAPARAQHADDARWTPWLGCWRATSDPAGTGARVCVTRADGGIAVRTVVGGQLVSDELRVADGAPRPVREAGCTGTETTRWSADGQRAYRTATASCGSEPARTLGSVTYFVPGPVWIDVQAVTLDGATNVRVTGYTRSTNQRLPDGTTVPQAPAGMAASLVSRGWTTDEVVEASAALPADGVQAAISEGPTAFRLNAKSLSQLADGRVAESVIDLMVALTYPERFVIDRPSSGGGGGSMLSGMGMLSDPFFSPIIGGAALYDCYSPYGWASTGYWDGCAGYNRSYGMNPGYYNGYYSGYYGAYGQYGSWINTNPLPNTDPGRTEGGGRVVNGRGYTQVRAVETPSANATNGDRSSGSSDGSSGSSSGGSSSGATSGGYSGGGGGGGDRMAVPRPPGQ